jgi:hypothetical protein
MGSDQNPIEKRAFRREIAERIVPAFRATWVAEPIFGRSLEWSEAQSRLGEINLQSALNAMARLNAASVEFSFLANPRSPAGQKTMHRLTRLLFPDWVRQSAWNIYLKADNFHPLAPQACIALTESCLRFCDRQTGIRFDWPEQCEAFSHVLLSFQSHLLRSDLIGPGTDFSALTDEQFRFLTKNYMAANYDPDGALLLIRHHMMFERPIMDGVLFQRTGTTADRWFLDVTQADPVVYRVLQLAMSKIGFGFTVESPTLDPLIDNLETALATLRPEIAAIFRRLHSQAVIRLGEVAPAKDPADWEAAVYSQHYLRRRSLLQLDEARFLCLHRQLLVEKFFGASVHVLTDMIKEHTPPKWAASENKRVNQLRVHFGYVFEDYLQQLLTLLFSEPEIIRRFGYRAVPESPERDALIVVGRTALVLEFVHHPWNLDERSNGASTPFIKHLSDNVAKTADISGLLDAGNPVADVRLSVDRILPIVVMSDVMPITEATAPTLVRDLVALCGPGPVNGHGKIAPVQTLSLSQLENLDRIFRRPLGPDTIVEFLAKRASRPLDRFCGSPYLDMPYGDIDRLQAFFASADRSFLSVGPGLFLPQK